MPKQIPTVGRIVHLYYRRTPPTEPRFFAGHRVPPPDTEPKGPFAGIVAQIPAVGDVRVRDLGSGRDFFENSLIPVSENEGEWSSCDIYTQVKWVWPPRE